MTCLTPLLTFIVAAPVEIADLEESVILTAICIEATHCSRVKAGFVLGYTHPCGDLTHGQLVLVVELLCQLTALVNLTFGLWLVLDFLLYFLFWQILSLKAAGNFRSVAIPAVPIVHSPSCETIT